MLLATVICSVICATTFLFARVTRSFDYRTFFNRLLGPFAVLFELFYCAYIILILAVFGAAAGAVGQALFGWPTLWGTLCLMAGMAYFTMFGNASVERLFKWVSIFLYATYAAFLLIALTKFGSRIATGFATAMSAPTGDWALGGITYAGYNVIAAVVILPTVRHFQSNADAVKAGLLAGPLAMLPAIIFFVCMCAFLPEILHETLPSDYVLRQMNLPLFHMAFQLMIFAALLESGTGSVHAVNERVATAYRRRGHGELSHTVRLASAAALLVGSIFLADRFGLVTLIAKGYRFLAYTLIGLYLIPLMTVGVWRLWRKTCE
jgi:uncharacterized membrane protein YkvI